MTCSLLLYSTSSGNFAGSNVPSVVPEKVDDRGILSDSAICFSAIEVCILESTLQQASVCS